MRTADVGALVKWSDATDLIGRVVVNEHGAEFVVRRLEFCSTDGRVWFWLVELDEGFPVPGSGAGVGSLDGFTVDGQAESWV